MTSILNKLVSACQTIEANGGSGGGSSDSEPEYKTSNVTLSKSSFSDRDCYIAFCSLSADHAESKIYITVNNELMARYYIEAVYHHSTESRVSFRVFKNSAASDSTELTFKLAQCSISTVEDNMYCIKVSGIDTITSNTFTVYGIHTYKGNLAALGDVRIKEIATFDKQFVPVT